MFNAKKRTLNAVVDDAFEGQKSGRMSKKVVS